MVLVHGYPLNGQVTRYLGTYGSGRVDRLTDFRDDLPKIDVPVPAIHGSADRIPPFEATAGRPPAVVAALGLVSVEGGPHNVCWTHHEEVSPAPLEFLAA